MSNEVEAEDLDSREGVRPWDPSKIRVTTKAFSLRQVIDEVKDGTIDLAPDFQRTYVWRPVQQARLIESILLGIPLPAFYFNEASDGTRQVVDGVQRLTTICRFAQDEFVAEGVEYLSDLEGKRFSELEPVWRRRLHGTQIQVHVIEPQTPPEVKFDIFKRINTGGSPLSAQEIRHSMSRARSRDFLKRLAALPSFHVATGHLFSSGLDEGRPDVRMGDRELVLRFLSFYRMADLEPFRRHATFDDFLMETTRRLDDPKECPDAHLEECAQAFDRAMTLATKVFGDHAFRKWPLGEDRKNPFNRALMECFAVALAEGDAAAIEAGASALRDSARRLMRDDKAFVTAITASTGGVNRVVKRFTATRAWVAGASS